MCSEPDWLFDAGASPTATFRFGLKRTPCGMKIGGASLGTESASRGVWKPDACMRTAPTPNQWHHVVWQRRGGTARCSRAAPRMRWA